MDDVYHSECGFSVPKEHIPSENDLERYAKGDQTVVDTLIAGLTQFVVNSVIRYTKAYGWAVPFKEDLTSESLLELVTVLNNKLGNRFTAPKLLGYINYCVVGNMNDWLRENVPTLTVPKTTQHRHGMGKKVPLKEYMRATQGEGVFSDVWFDDFMVAQTPIDQRIIRCKLEGKTDHATANEMGLEQRTVAAHLEKLYDSYIGE